MFAMKFDIIFIATGNPVLQSLFDYTSFYGLDSKRSDITDFLQLGR
jgi:hypothetical protein